MNYLNSLKNSLDSKLIINGVAASLATGVLLYGLMKSHVKPLKEVAKVAKGGN